MGNKKMTYEWVNCPCCGKRLIRRYRDTHVRELRLYCKQCAAESTFNF